MTIPLRLLLLACPLLQQPTPEPLTYPTFEPFVAARMFPVFGDAKTADLAKLAKHLSLTQTMQVTAREAALKHAPPRTSSLSALLEPRVADDERFVAPLVPLALMKLEPLWNASTWTAAQVTEASATLAILGRIADAPKPVFAEGKDAENRAGLEELVRWFQVKVARPEWYAALIFSLDDGPFIGLPHEADGPLPAQAVQALDEKTELRLCRVERDNEPWVLQVVREGRPLWSRVLSAAPDESVAEASFLPDPVQRVGPYGWKVQLLVRWSGGEEPCEVFLDPEANLLFYFLSW